MGQQQLFLIVIVTIIAGIATVIAINTMDVSRRGANESAVRQDIFSVLTDARVYYQKSELINGKKSFDGFSLNDAHSVQASNENGSYTVSGAGQSVTVTAVGAFNDVNLSAIATMTNGDLEINWSE